MILIPFDRAIDWSRPPVITITLILLNVLLYFAWQSGEDQALARAADYWQQSGLAAIEEPAYEKYLSEQDKAPSLGHPLMAIETDRGFQHRMLSGLVVARDDPEFHRWQQNRQRLQQMLAKVTYLEYGLKPAKPDLASLFAHMFLHGSISHLLGNMFFLFAVGFLVEATVGRWLFLGCYLLGGLGSAGLDILLSPDRLIPGIGASGAIAGLMGLYAVLFWTRKVRFFYFLVVYFDYVKLPAIVLLPLWLGNELYQIWQHGDSGVNYIAHLGGLLSGAFLGLLVRNMAPSFSLQAFEDNDRQQLLEQQLDDVRQLCRDLDYQKALPLLRRLHRQHPDDRELLHLLQQATRLDPASEEYHQVNQAILALPADDRIARELLLDTLSDYLEHAKPAPRLNQQLACRLAPMLIDSGRLGTGQRLFRTLLRNDWPCPAAAATVSRLADALDTDGQTDEAGRYRQLLKKLSTR